MQIRLATRGSRLALAQSGMVADALRGLGAEVELVRVRTLGDVSTAPLSSLGGVGVFVAAVREAVLDGGCDLAVHSMKDLPTTPAAGLVVAAIPEREDPRDALCARDGLTLTDLPSGAKVGTGSPRRAAQLRAARPDLHIVDIRGNVDTRLGRVGDDLDAVVLAAAGLNRLGRSDAVTEFFEPDALVPAPAQGALALECRTGDTELRGLLARLDHRPTRIAVSAERDLMRLIEAGCAAPFGALATVGDGGLRLRARLAHPDATVTLARDAATEAASRLVAGLAEALLPLRRLRVVMPPSALADAVAARGAEVTPARLTRQRPVADPALPGRLADLAAGGYDWLTLTSARTLEALDAGGVDLAAAVPPVTRVAAVGPRTAAAARAAGLRVDLVPSGGSGGADLAADFPEPAGRVLVPGAAEPAPGLDEALRARGWRVDRVAVYRTDPVESIEDEIRRAWPDGFDAFVVTAPSVVRAAADLLGPPGPPAIALGETSAAAARDAGFTVAAVAAEATPAGLVDALATLRKEVR